MASSGAQRQGYHHGNLRQALLEAGLELTRNGGPSALAMREVTRRLGVSPNAAYRHFADRDSLLSAVAEQIQQQMVARMLTHASGGRTKVAARERLRAVGLGYIEFALREPGWFETAFGDIQPVDPAAGGHALPSPLTMLVSALDALVASGDLAETEREGAEWPCWSAVHGFALLALHGPLRGRPHDQLWPAAERTVDAVIAGLLL
ncbi:TetR/AcrR family transcriptional regulator [Microlunatus elymi]|uniref:TetR/AcrR family transcriptional regulator n=1 Tax=Microlunatus elymi TaxID=2596828 RepID=UPI001AEF4DA0|nr:TetR/AcrR family transcriptional regulator [Microlunatus elymi]